MKDSSATFGFEAKFWLTADSDSEKPCRFVDLLIRILHCLNKARPRL